MAAKRNGPAPDLGYIAKDLRPLAIPIARLKPDPSNARLHDGRNVDAIRASLAEFGQRKPVVVQKRGRIIRAGNGTLEAARALGWTHLAVVTEDDDDATATAFGIADNRTAELASWDEAKVAALLADLEPELAAASGFDQAEIDRLVADANRNGEIDEDDVPEPPADPVTKLGDVWTLGRHRVVCGDSTETSVVATLLQGAVPFIMVTDPPYGVGLDQGWRDRIAGVNLMGKAQSDHLSGDDREDWTGAYLLFQGAVAYVWHDGLHTHTVLQNLEHAGLAARSQILWSKTRFAMGRCHYHWQHEPCWYAVRAGSSAKWCGDRTQSTVWEMASPKHIMGGSLEDKEDHPTQKPQECMARPIRNHGGRADHVYDPFLGSGTTLIAAEQLDRTCYGVEISPAYCDVVCQRWEALTGQKAERTR